MNKTSTKTLFLLLFASLFFWAGKTTAQTITVNYVDPGPYGQGATIMAGIQINDAAGCIRPNNVFQLYLSDATGNFGSETLIGTFGGPYAAFVNGKLPASAAAGTGYRLRVKSTFPAVTSAPSAAFSILGLTGNEAGISAPLLNSQYPEVLGLCNGVANSRFNFTSSSTAGTVTSVDIVNEQTGASEANMILNPSGSFNAKTAHYTIRVRALSGNGVATKGYLLINNQVNNAFGATGSNTVCLQQGGGELTYNVDVSSANGLQNNYPGNTYTVNWGDGSSTTFTFCEIRNAGGKISHTYTQPSCGKVVNGRSNVYEVTLQPKNVYCGNIGTQVTSYAKVLDLPVGSFTNPGVACTNTEVTFQNTSYPGQDPDNTTGSCTNFSARYTWYVDGNPVKFNATLSEPFKYTFTTPGIHRIGLEMQNSSGICTIGLLEDNICIQNPPQPKFTLPSSVACTGSAVSPTDQSIVDANCNANNTYTWTVTGPAPVTYAGGTNATSKVPQFVFTTAGVYRIKLAINTQSCGKVETAEQELVVNTTPVATLSADAELCGNNQTLTFNQVAGITQTTLSGTSQAQFDTYTWTVTGGSYTFENGTTSISQYPSIKFLDYATYTVTVTHKNNCGTTSDSQVITFKPAPTVNAGTDLTICPGATATLNGSINGSYISYQWTGGNGTFSPSRNVLNPTYTPTAAEVSAGQVVLTLRATTSLPAPCNVVPDDVTIFINPVNNITSPASKPICTGTAVNYNITSTVAGSTFTWTAALISGNASGFAATGSGTTIADVITNNDPNVNAVVRYIITPQSNGCSGTPFTLNITVTPNPIVTATAPNLTLCNGEPTNITLASNVSATSYTWTSTVNGSITGNSNQSTLTATTKIDDLLFNNSTTPATVTYTITPISSIGCPGAPTTITITVQPSPVQANAGADDRQCNITTYQLKGNSPGTGTGLWTLRSGQLGVTFADATNPATAVNGLQPGQTYVFRWTITASASCPSTFDDVQIISDPPSVGGTTTGTITVCSGNNTGQITLAGQTGNVIRWESSLDGATWQPVTNATTTLTYNNLTQTTQYRAVVQSGNCSIAFSSVSIVTVNPRALAAVAGPDVSLCNETSYRLQGNNPGTFTGVWTLQSGPAAGVTFADATQYNTVVSGLQPGQSYIFRWTIKGLPPCGDSFDDVVVTILSPVINNISTVNTTICAGQATSITGDVPTGGTGTYAFSWESSTDNINWTLIPGETSRDLSIQVAATTYFRRSVSSGTCADSKSNVIKVTTQQAIANNTISTTVQDICVNNSPGLITGSTPTGGDGNFFYRWQSSLDGTNWTDITGATNKDYNPPVLATSIQYRRIVSSTLCAGPRANTSNVISIIVNQNAKAEYSFTRDADCIPFVINSQNIKATDYPNQNQQYTWYADGVVIGTGLAFPGYTINEDGKSVVIKLVVTSKHGCLGDEFSHTFTTTKQVTANFTTDKTTGCGPLTVQFTNTSAPLTGATYFWDFGNGITSTKITPDPVSFVAQNNGRDSVYTVTLTATTSCSVTKHTVNITVRPKPVLIAAPNSTSGCSPFTAVITNNSPGTNNQYIYDWGDGSAPETYSDTRNAQHQYTTATRRNYTITIRAQNECGFIESKYVITVSPNTVTARLTVNGNEKRGCVPLTTNFFNNSVGGSSFTYDFGDGIKVQSNTSPQSLPHTYTQPGTYHVVLTATNGCSVSTDTTTIIVDPLPVPAFTANQTTGCGSIKVKFNNTTPNASSIVKYTWDFGDGTISNEVNPEHTFDYTKSPYTVKLTAQSALGCDGTTARTNYITVVAPALANFRIEPDSIVSIPNYRFSFVDETVGDVGSRTWTFGDGSTSTAANPSHTYADTGRYQVTLTVKGTAEGSCPTTKVRHVRITGVPGQLFLPNAFMPSGTDTELQTFKAKGSGLQEWHMRIFNNWGQLVWETTKLSSRGEPVDGWDGTFKGSPAPQGVYTWEITAKFINGFEWKGMTYNNGTPRRTGMIHLIR